MKYTKKFNDYYEFYLLNSSYFNFCGREICVEYSCNGVSAKEAFYQFDTNGKHVATSEIDEYTNVMRCKASINFHIKMWAEGFLDINMTIDEYLEDMIFLQSYIRDTIRTALINQIMKKYPYLDREFLEKTYYDNSWIKQFMKKRAVRVNDREHGDYKKLREGYTEYHNKIYLKYALR